MNIKSSIEAKLVGRSDYVPYNLWLIMFMGKQGYPIRNNILYQNNQSKYVC